MFLVKTLNMQNNNKRHLNEQKQKDKAIYKGVSIRITDSFSVETVKAGNLL